MVELMMRSSNSQAPLPVWASPQPLISPESEYLEATFVQNEAHEAVQNRKIGDWRIYVAGPVRDVLVEWNGSVQVARADCAAASCAQGPRRSKKRQGASKKARPSRLQHHTRCTYSSFAHPNAHANASSPEQDVVAGVARRNCLFRQSLGRDLRQLAGTAGSSRCRPPEPRH